MRAARAGGLSSAKEGWVQSRLRQRVNEKARIARILRILAVPISLSPLLTGWPANKWSESALLKKTARLFRFGETAGLSRNAANAHFVQVPQQVGRILIDAIGTSAIQLVLTVATGEQSNSKRIGAARCE